MLALARSAPPPGPSRRLLGPLCPAQRASRGLTVVHGDDVQGVQQLALVLVDPLHVHVKHGVGVQLDLVVLLQVASQLHLVLLERGSERKGAEVRFKTSKERKD